MSRFRSFAAGAVLLLCGALCRAEAVAPAIPAAPSKKTLSAFASDDELRAFLKRSAGPARPGRMEKASGGVQFAPLAPAPAPMAEAAAPQARSVASPAPAGAAPESVTNNQSAGVDEGGIVKLHGQHLVMLRRGRLFTVDIGRGQLAPISTINAYGPGADPSGGWYDEMLISGDTVVVIGYSYSGGGTEVGLFDIDPAGRLAYRATYHMKSNDYYSSRNYASRLIGSKLIFYTPLSLDPWRHDPFDSFPAMRRWRPGAEQGDFKRIAPATRIYRTDEPLPMGGGLTLHTVTVCDLAGRDMRCEASAVLGPRGRVFYVSGQAVYVWTGGHRGDGGSGVFRLPLDGGAPSALKVAGSPLDQFSFLESADRHLNVLVRADGEGDGMWSAERGAGALALLRVPLDMFSDGRDSAPASSYRPLPRVQGYRAENRYVGQYLLYGSGGPVRPYGNARDAVYAVRWDRLDPLQALELPHQVDRIEALGENAVVIGGAGPDLHFTSVRLGDKATLAGRLVRSGAAQSESRSHGFFYKAEATDQGVIGLPVLSTEDGGDGRAPASVLYLKNQGLRLSSLGSLASRPGIGEDDACQASCVDWYGNARPLFVQDRVFALMGYELVEGRRDGQRLVERRRISFAPPPPFGFIR